MTRRIDPEALVAYVDGQLDQSETARIEGVLAGDPEARETVRRLRESAELLRSAFNEPLNEPVPARVLEAFHATAAERTSRAGAWRSPWPVALAASIAMLIFGLGGGVLLELRRRTVASAHADIGIKVVKKHMRYYAAPSRLPNVLFVALVEPTALDREHLQHGLELAAVGLE